MLHSAGRGDRAKVDDWCVAGARDSIGSLVVVVPVDDGAYVHVEVMAFSSDSVVYVVVAAAPRPA